MSIVDRDHIVHAAGSPPTGRFTPFILAGGESRRMGRDKAWVEVEGRPMIEWVVAAANEVGRVRLVIRREMPERWRYVELAQRAGGEIIDDRVDRLGPLGGIATALDRCCPGENAVILAGDMPCLTGEFLGLLVRIHDAANTAGKRAGVTVPVGIDGRLHPLAAIWHRSCLPRIEAMLVRGNLKVRDLLDEVAVRRVEFAEYRHLSGAERMLTNINSPPASPVI